MLAGSTGKQLLPVVRRNGTGNPVAVTGAVWTCGPATGLPRKMVFGNFLVIFTNRNPDCTAADVARISGPMGYLAPQPAVGPDTA
ncbi:hypothetical protein KBD49_05705 [Myxococcota bacterium]|nr:hypothetical protein [Myxococcota bacterium]